MEPLPLSGNSSTSETERETDLPVQTPAEAVPEDNGLGHASNGVVEDLSPGLGSPVSPRASKKTKKRRREETERKQQTPLLLSYCPPVPTVAMFCHEAPDSAVGRQVGKIVQALARRHVEVVLFCRLPFAIEQTGVTVHAVGPASAEDLMSSVETFARQAAEVYGRQFPAGSAPSALLGHEWTTIPLLLLLREHTKKEFQLSLQSLERQRSDMTSAISQSIEEIEACGLCDAAGILVQDQAVGDAIKHWLPECGDRLHLAAQPFPTRRFTGVTDPGAIKARYQIGPVDPTILFVGNMDEAHGPDLLMKSIPAIVRNNRQARFVFVGDGDLLWPLRVYVRYLLLEGVVRLTGHMEGQALDELIQAADVVVVPSRRPTEWWPFQAAWAARRPVVATHPLAPSVLEHEKDCVLVYPHESSVVWGVERLLFDARFRELLGHRGHEKLEERFGWNSVAGQLETLLGLNVKTG
jgi:glycosyltransferase involved in cell wall biosynthesis